MINEVRTIGSRLSTPRRLSLTRDVGYRMREVKSLLLILALLVLVGCRATPHSNLFYSPGIHNHDTDVSSWPSGGYLHPDFVADWTASALRWQYELHTNRFRGAVVVHRYIGTNHTICIDRSMICDSASNLYRVGSGYEMTNAVTMESFDEILADIYDKVKQDVSNQRVEDIPRSGRK